MRKHLDMGGKRGKTSSTPISPTPVAVVVDANLWGSGIVDLKRLAGHAERLGRSGIEVWVPGQVILEWSSHARRDVMASSAAWKNLQRNGLVAAPFPISDDIEAIVAAVCEKVSGLPNVKILPMLGESAIAGIRDQILETGPGRSIHGVKSGASDSSWVRDALAAGGGDASKIVFISGNAKDVHRAAASAGASQVEVRSEYQLYASIFGVNTAPEEVTGIVAKYLVSLIPPTEADVGHSPAHEPWIQIDDFSLPDAVDDRDYLFETTQTSLDATPELIALRNVEVVEANVQDFSATVEFDVLLLGDVTLNGYEIDGDGGAQTTWRTLYDSLITAPFVADIKDLHVQDIQQQGPAQVEQIDTHFSDGDDARSWLADVVGGFSGITIDDDDPQLQEWNVLGLAERSVGMTFALDWEEWEVTLDVPGSPETISCAYDPSTRVWAGKDSFDMFPPYLLAATDGGPSGVYAALGKLWRYLIGATG